MKPVKNMIMTAVLAAMTCGAAHAALVSHGTATGTITVQDGSGWSIALKQNGVSLRDADGNLRDSVAGASELKFTVKNDSSVAGVPYLRGAGTSLQSDGTIWAIDGDKHFNVHPTRSGNAWSWDGTETAYKLSENIAANQEKETVITFDSGTQAEPGVYTVNLELFTKAA